MYANSEVAARAVSVNELNQEIMEQSPSYGPVVPEPVHVPAWTQLDGDLHLQTLRQDYAPVGLLEMIPSAGRTLDVGCFCGGTGRWLKQKFPLCDLTGIEMLEKAAEIAKPAYDRIIVGRFETIDLGESGMTPRSFDTIITADFLEHLVNPWKALQRLKPLLRSDGALYVSIPNVRNLNLLANLAKGSWPYEGAGIQDVTHLRFFTRSSLVQMLMETGWSVDEIRVNPDPRLLPVFKGQDLSTITTINIGSMSLTELTRDDVHELLALQFFVRARPA